LSDAVSIEAAFRSITASNSIVGLVNNAGTSISHSIEDTETSDFEKLVPLNLVGPILCAKHSIESMKQAGWGRIVNITSRGALGKEKRSAYAATKGGLAAMTRVWALELAEFGITANNVGPGPIATELFRAVNPDDSPATQQIIDSVPVKRLGTPADVAAAIMFFLDPNSGFVTGQTLYVCGGMTV
jgi:NAD(P)-dependent dehydrogenase (short-subunit alcohol dehydrogenase family)